MSWKIPPLSRQRLYSSLSTYLLTMFDASLGRVNRGPALQGLSARLQQDMDVDVAIPVNQARVGLYLVVRAVLKLRGNGRRKVIMSPYTIFDVVNMVIAADGEPVFADIEAATCNVDPAEVERLVDDDTAAVLVTHLHGLCCAMDRIRDACVPRGIAVVEDAAQSVGSRYNGRHVGTLGDVGVYSFGMMKNVNGLYGGAVLTNDAGIAAYIRAELDAFQPMGASDLCKRAAYGAALDIATTPAVFRLLTYWLFRFAVLHDIGAINVLSCSEQRPVLRAELPHMYCRRMSSTQARLVLAQLDRIEQHSAVRRATAMRYFETLKGIGGIGLPPKRLDGSHTYMVFPVRVAERNAVIRSLFRAGRDVTAQHLRNCADLDVFTAWYRDCPVAREVSGSVVLLPTYPRYGLDEAGKTASALGDALEQIKAGHLGRSPGAV